MHTESVQNQPTAPVEPAPGLRSPWRWIVPIGLLAGAFVLCLTAFSRNREFYNDDALISLRYAQNLLRGDGLVWNPGERVEGYTNFLFVMGVSALGSIGVDLEVASRLINLIAFACLTGFVGAVCLRECREKGIEPGLATVPACLILSSFLLVCNVLGGLEAPLLALLLAVGLHLCTRSLETGEPRLLGWSGLAFALACMTRPDTALFAGIAVIAMVWRSLHGRLSRRGPWLFAAVLGGLYVPYFLIRWHYYGAPFPNTFYVKAEGFRLERWLVGLKYLAASFCEPPYLIPLGLGSVVALFAVGGSGPRARLLGGCLAAGLIYVASVGGDHMPAFRLMVPLVPLATWLVFDAMTGPLARRFGRHGVLVATAVLVGLSALQLDRPALNPIVEDPAALVGRIVGRWIRVAWPSGSLVALNTAGSTPYCAPENRYIDMLGLNDAHIARRQVDRLVLPWQHVPGHTKGDGVYVLDRKPDFIIFGPAQGTIARRPWFLSDLEMSLDPRLQRDYVLRQVLVPTVSEPGYRRHFETTSGALVFTYYERISQARAGSESDPRHSEVH